MNISKDHHQPLPFRPELGSAKDKLKKTEENLTGINPSAVLTSPTRGVQISAMAMLFQCKERWAGWRHA